MLYGIGARLDEQPELIFKLRAVDEKELIAKAGKGLPLAKKGPASEKVLAGGDLSEVFGLEMAQSAQSETEAGNKRVKPRRAKKLRATREKTARATSSKSVHRRASGTRSRANVPPKKRGATKRR